MFFWRWHRGISIRRWANSFTNFKYVVKDYENLDADVKSAVMKASSSVVSIISRSGNEVLFIGSGTIIERDEHGIATILTSATLLKGATSTTSIPSNLKIDVYLADGKLYEGEVSVYDFYYNIATVTIKSTSPLLIANIRSIDDGIAIDVGSRLVKHSTKFNLCPGDQVIAVGRDFTADHEIMASPGIFSARDCCHDCKELFLTSCVVTKLAVGGPLINLNGEVIGLNFFICPYTAFIPINVVSKCLEDLKRNRHVPRPWVGAFIANLYTADLEKLDRLYQKFPNVSSAVIVEQVIGRRSTRSRERTKTKHWAFGCARDLFKARAVIQYEHNKRRIKIITRKRDRTKSRTRRWQESPAIVAGICSGDVIIKCGEVPVNSHLEFVEALWDKERKLVELVLIRPSVGQQTVTLSVGTNPKKPRWEIYKRLCTPVRESTGHQEKGYYAVFFSLYLGFVVVFLLYLLCCHFLLLLLPYKVAEVHGFKIKLRAFSNRSSMFLLRLWAVVCEAWAKSMVFPARLK